MTFKTLAAAAAITVAASFGAVAQPAPAPMGADRPATTGSVTPPGAPGSGWSYPTGSNDKFSTRPVPDTVPKTQQGFGEAGGPAKELNTNR